LNPTNGEPINPLDAFDRVNGAGQGGVHIRDIYVTLNGKSMFVNGTAPGTLAGGNATINVSNYYVSALNPASIQLGVNSYAMTGLHESIHHGSNLGFGDAQLAQAAYNLMSPDRQAGATLPNGSDVVANSRFWDKELEGNCDPLKR
jgi:hypothetical protein